MKQICLFLKLFIVMLCISETAAAQSYIENMLSYKVTAHYPDHMINAHVRPVDKIVVKNDKDYYWFSGSQINITRGGYSGKLLNGDYEDLYTNKNLKASGIFDEGLKTGIWKSWTAEGMLKDQYSFHAGHRNGPYLLYDTAGKVREKGIYHQDLLDGRQETASGDSTIVVHYKKGKISPPKRILPKFIYKILPKKSPQLTPKN